jgi:hypothetical protein
MVPLISSHPLFPVLICSVAPPSETRWRVPSHTKHDVIIVQFQSHAVGKFEGYLHIKTNFDDMVVPVEIHVIRGGIVASPASINFHTFASDEVDCSWSQNLMRAANTWADTFPDAIAVSAFHSRVANVGVSAVPVRPSHLRVMLVWLPSRRRLC